MSQFVDFKAVKAAVSMLQVLERYGLAETFKRSENSLSGPCPLHNGQNKTQFRVSLDKNCWNCFGTCKGGGNVLDFVAQEEQIGSLVGAKGHIALMLDNDEAGLSGRTEALQRFAALAYVRVIELRNFGRQPDELSSEQLQELLLGEETGDYEVAAAKFPTGRIVATPNALRSLSELDIRTSLARHVRGEWGDLDEHDKAENELSLREGFRLLSAYRTADGTKFWIITEADRSATTVLLPKDY
jgi:hypothetical protein